MEYRAGEKVKNGKTFLLATMKNPNDLQTIVPPERWDIDDVYAPDILPGTMSINARCD
jgi:hypothetical protein